MAKQIAGLCFLEGTIDDLTFYKMDGQYYVRVKSSLSSQRVKTSPEFKWTMIYARLLARASKIGSAIYKELPPGWRQFWMYRSFTGEAFTLLKENPYTDDQVKQLLWKCYVEYWEQKKITNPISPSAGGGRGEDIWQPKPTKVRKRRKYSNESLLRKKDKYGKSIWKDKEAIEKRLEETEKKRAWCSQHPEQEAQQTNTSIVYSIIIEQAIPISLSQSANKYQVAQKQPGTQNTKPATISTWQVASNGTLQTTGTCTSPLYADETCNSS